MKSVEVSLDRLYDFWPPFPVVLVSTLSKTGVPDVAPYGMDMMISFDPPIVALGIVKTRKTYANILSTGEFVVNVPTDKLVDKINKAAWSCPPEIDKFKKVGLTQMPSLKVKAPSVKECKIRFECKLDWTKETGDHDIVIGRVVAITVDEDLAKASPEKLKPKTRPVFYGMKRYYALGKLLGSRTYG